MANLQSAEPDHRRSAVRIRPQPQVQRDAVSRLIIEQLQQDGRRSYAAIAKAVGLSEPAVRQRVQRLIESGAMQIAAVTDPMTLGFHRQAGAVDAWSDHDRDIRVPEGMQAELSMGDLTNRMTGLRSLNRFWRTNCYGL